MDNTQLIINLLMLSSKLEKQVMLRLSKKCSENLLVRKRHIILHVWLICTKIIMCVCTGEWAYFNRCGKNECILKMKTPSAITSHLKGVAVFSLIDV